MPIAHGELTRISEARWLVELGEAKVEQKMTKLYVGNLSSEVTGEELRKLFICKGFPVTSARVICDREGGRSRGFGFVEIGSHADAELAINELDGLNLEGRVLQVKDARPQTSRDGR